MRNKTFTIFEILDEPDPKLFFYDNLFEIKIIWMCTAFIFGILKDLCIIFDIFHHYTFL